MKNEEYISKHPEQFKDDIDKWLFTEFGIIGGCCSAQGSMEYSVARMVAERYSKNIVDKACNYLFSHSGKVVTFFDNDSVEYIDRNDFIKGFRQAIGG